MGAVYQRSLATYYNNGANVWELHGTLTLTPAGRRARVKFNSLSAGAAITALTLKIVTTAGSSGVMTFYATADPNLLPNSMESGVYVGTANITSGTGTKTLTFSQAMMDAVSQFTGEWYLMLYQSTYIEITGGGASNAPLFEGTYADGSIYTGDGGVMKLSAPWVSDGGVMKQGVVWVSDGGVMKQGIP